MYKHIIVAQGTRKKNRREKTMFAMVSLKEKPLQEFICNISEFPQSEKRFIADFRMYPSDIQHAMLQVKHQITVSLILELRFDCQDPCYQEEGPRTHWQGRRSTSTHGRTWYYENKSNVALVSVAPHSSYPGGSLDFQHVFALPIYHSQLHIHCH